MALVILPRFFARPVGLPLLSIRSRPVRTVLRWQIIATGVIALAAALIVGSGGAISAVLGGLINVVAGVVYFAIASMGRLHTAGDTIRRLIRAESSKIMVIVGLTWLALTQYKGIEFVPFFIAFAIAALLPGVAFMVRDEEGPQIR